MLFQIGCSPLISFTYGGHSPPELSRTRTLAPSMPRPLDASHPDWLDRDALTLIGILPRCLADRPDHPRSYYATMAQCLAIERSIKPRCLAIERSIKPRNHSGIMPRSHSNRLRGMMPRKPCESSESNNHIGSRGIKYKSVTQFGSHHGAGRRGPHRPQVFINRVNF